jgi:hypothetical protein
MIFVGLRERSCVLRSSEVVLEKLGYKGQWSSGRKILQKILRYLTVSESCKELRCCLIFALLHGRSTW